MRYGRTRGPGRVERRSAHQPGQHLAVDDALVEQRPHERHLNIAQSSNSNNRVNQVQSRRVVVDETDVGFARDLNAEEVIGQRVDDDEHVAKLGGDDAASVVAAVLRPHDVHLVVAQVAHLLE